MFKRMEKKPTPTLRDLYPQLTDEQLAEVEDTLEQYLAVALEIFERREVEERIGAGQLTPDAEEIPCDMQEDSQPQT